MGFDPSDTSYFTPSPSGRGELTIRELAEHGVRVKQGDLLVVFDATRLDEAIDTVEFEQKSLQANIKLARG